MKNYIIINHQQKSGGWQRTQLCPLGGRPVGMSCSCVGGGGEEEEERDDKKLGEKIVNPFVDPFGWIGK